MENDKSEFAKLRDEVLALVERRFDALETDLRKSIADVLEGHGQMLATMGQGIADIRALLVARDGRRAPAAAARPLGVMPAPSKPLARAVAGAPVADLRDRARIVVYEVYELPTERTAALSTEQRAELDAAMGKLEAFIAQGESELSDDELVKLIARVAKLIAPPSTEAKPRGAQRFMGKGKAARGARAFF